MDDANANADNEVAADVDDEAAVDSDDAMGADTDDEAAVETDDEIPAGVDEEAATDGPFTERIRARGHEHVTAEHQSTIEVTTDDWLTPAGDCIVGIEADRTPADFDEAFVDACQSAEATITAEFAVDADEDSLTDTIVGRGDPELTFAGDRSSVGRTSDHTDDRTVFVGAAGAAADLDRDVVDALSNGAPLTLTLTVEP